MPRTTNKGVRFTAAELTCIDTLRPQLPEYTSDADLLRHAALLGMLVLATQATRPGMTPYAGYRADDLAALLRPRLLPALDFLAVYDSMPSIAAPRQVLRVTSELQAAETTPQTALGVQTTEAAPHAPDPAAEEVAVIEAATSGELYGLGTDMMND